MTALALTEHGNVSSWVQLEKACKSRGIKPIFGLEAYVASENVQPKFHMILLAADQEGLANLNAIVTASWKTLGNTSKTKFPTVHMPMLRKHHRGIIVLSGCATGPISCLLLGGKSLGDERLTVGDRDFQNARRAVEKFQEIFGDRYYIETQRFSGLARTRALNPAFEELSKTTGSRMVATADVHYPYPDENVLQRVLHAAHRGNTVEGVDLNWEYDILLTYPTTDSEVYKDLLGTGLSEQGAKLAVENASLVAAKCNVTLPKAPLPNYILGERDWKPWT